jgi:type II secretory ATPase GspE/PulE/Tfp pilus assembly ATPase PilB-like protein
VGVFESLWLDEQMNDDLLQGKIPTHAQIHHQAERYQQCYRSMAQDALEKIHAGQTSRAELHKIGLNMKAVAPPTTAI